MKKTILIGITLGILIFLFITNKDRFITSQTSPATLTSQISNLEDVTLNGIEIKERVYDFDKGKITEGGKSVSKEEEQKVKNFVFFYLAIKEDPLFTSPDLDAKELENSIELLKQEENEFNKLIKKNEHFFPTIFLEKIPRVKKQETVFLEKLSYKEAQNLLNLYNETAQSYKNEAEKFSEVVTKDNRIKISYYSFINTLTTKEILLSDIRKIAGNAENLLKEINDRKLCLEKGLSCQRSISNISSPSENIKKEIPKLLDKNLLFVGLDITKNVRGPYIIKTSCFGYSKDLKDKENSIYINLAEYKKGNYDLSYLSFKLASDNYYRKPNRDLWDKEFPKKYDRIRQKETSNYLCSDLSYQAKLATLDSFFQEYRTKPIIFKIDPKEVRNTQLLNSAKEFEQDFFNDKFPGENNMIILSNYYINLYKEVQNQELRDELLKRYLIITRKLSNFHLVLNNVAYDFLRTIKEEEKKPGSMQTSEMLYSYIYLFRTAWSLNYLTFSPSVWRSKPIQFFEKMKNIGNPKEPPYITSEEMLKKLGGDKEKLKELNRISIETNKKMME